jgi:limonene 1,2-monooxygenase
MWSTAGGFGCILIKQTHWTNEDVSYRSYRTFVEEVMPAFAGTTQPRQESHEWTRARRADLTAGMLNAATKTIQDHFAETGASAAASVGVPGQPESG